MARGGEVPTTFGSQRARTDRVPLTEVLCTPADSQIEGRPDSIILPSGSDLEDQRRRTNTPVPSFVADSTLSAVKGLCKEVLEWLLEGGFLSDEALLLRLLGQVSGARTSAEIVFVVRCIESIEASVVSFINIWAEEIYGKRIFADNIPVSIEHQSSVNGIKLLESKCPEEIVIACNIAEQCYQLINAVRDVYEVEWWQCERQFLDITFEDHWASRVFERSGGLYRGYPPAPPESSSDDECATCEQVSVERSETMSASSQQPFVGYLERNGGCYEEIIRGIDASADRFIPDWYPKPKSPEQVVPVAQRGFRFGDVVVSPRADGQRVNDGGGLDSANLDASEKPDPTDKLQDWVSTNGEWTKVESQTYKTAELTVESLGQNAQPNSIKHSRAHPILITDESGATHPRGCQSPQHVPESGEQGGKLEAKVSEPTNTCKGYHWRNFCFNSQHLIVRIYAGIVGLEDRVNIVDDDTIRQCVEGLDAKELQAVYKLACSGEFDACCAVNCGIARLVDQVGVRIASIQENDTKYFRPWVCKESLGDEAALEAAGASRHNNDGCIQTSNLGARNGSEQGDHQRKPERRCDVGAGAETQTDLDVHKPVTRSPDNAKKCSPKRDGGKRRSKEAKLDPGRKNKGDRRSNNDRNDSNGTRVGGIKVVHQAQEPHMENVQLHEGREDRMVGRSRSIPSPEVATTEMGADTTCVLTSKQVTTGDTIQASFQLQNACRCSKPRELCDKSTQSTEDGMGPANLADSNPQLLCPQRGEELTRSGSNHVFRTRAGSHGSNVSTDSANGKVDAATNPIRRFGGVDMLLSSSEEETLSKAGSLSFKRPLRVKGCDYQIVCKIRKTKNPGPRRGPQNDTGEKPEIQSSIRDVHQSNRAQLVSSNGPSGRKDGATNTTCGQGSKPFPKGRQLKEDVGPDDKSSSDQSGFKQVGSPRKRGHAQTNAPIVSDNYAGSDVESPIELPARKPRRNEKRGKVQSEGGRHEWRYDNSTGQLHCSDCNTASFSRSTVRMCFGARLNYVRRLPNASGNLSPSSRVVRYTSRRNDQSGGQITNNDVRRRGRPRSIGGKRDSANSSPIVASMVEVNGTRTESGGNCGTIPPDSVLPTQASPDCPGVGNDAGSKQSPGNSVFSHLPVSEATKKLLGDSLDRQVSATSGNTHPGTTVRETGSGVEGCGEAQRGGVPAHPPGTRNECQSPKTFAKVASSNPDNARTKNYGDGAVAGPTRSAKNARRNGSDDAKVKKSSQKKGLEGRKPGSYPNIDFIERDIFTPLPYAVAHCVGADFKMGAGVAKGFVAKFGRPNVSKLPATCGSVHLQNVRDSSGDLVVMHMVTKPLSAVPAVKDPKSYIHVERCLKIVAKHVKNTMGKTDIAIPNLIGCGLDGMERNKILRILQRVGQHYNVYWVVHKNPSARS